MARSYTLGNLLDRLLRETAAELLILADNPPFIIGRNDRVAVGSTSITNDNIADLLNHLATVDQMRELIKCGDVHFIYLFRNWVRFSVIASIAPSNAFSITIKNLGR
jgi:Tfp pilus assembly ATPase PilU